MTERIYKYILQGIIRQVVHIVPGMKSTPSEALVVSMSKTRNRISQGSSVIYISIYIVCLAIKLRYVSINLT